jgi:hypothetical protein
MAKKAATNDDIILKLKKDIEEKKKLIKSSERFTPVTNCSLVLDDERFNLNVLTKDQIIPLMVKLNAYAKSAEELGVIDELQYAGFGVKDWLTDLKARWGFVNRMQEEARLKTLEAKLDKLISSEKQVELAIADIAASI